MVPPSHIGTLALTLLGLLTVLPRLQVEAFYIQIDIHEEECFFEQGMTGATVVLSFEVTKGGFLDIDVHISGPDNDYLIQLIHERSGSYSFVAHKDGAYKFWFSMSTLMPEMVMFTIHVGPAPSAGLGEDEEDGPRTKLEKMMEELTKALLAIKHKQKQMEIQEEIHRAISEATDRKLVLLPFFEAAVLLAMTFGQIYYLKNFFQVQRIHIQVDTMA
ncbi:transmembrane emp24 domain-containing protein 2-like isoform X2 [Petaurus breviceps papuanus]|uniref:transmembrane emp24 domain-containing protein 2-like isoform X2 n=1 Tax=Petaurus breviceps papuanus TaxID=3040969 RepID=UPI0036DB1C26